MPQAVVNIGMVGHVDHGKTTLTEALTGIWTDTHSEEIRRGISIRLGYADVTFRKCPACEAPQAYTIKETCPVHGVRTEVLRRVSFVDAPGHETLMATMLSGAAIMDGAILVIAANEKCPQPQTKEHLMALEITGVKNIIIAQNKIELVSREQVIRNYNEIRDFLSTTSAADAPIVPVSAIHKANIDLLIQTIEERIPTPKRDLTKPPRMHVARSFDVNRPGTRPEDLVGGVIGGSLLQGKFSVDDEIEIRPGVHVSKEGKRRWQPLTTKIVSLQAGYEFLQEAGPGGLIGVGTKLDPSLTKSDSLVGSVVGEGGELPPILEELEMDIHLLKRVVGTAEELEVKPLVTGETLMINAGTAATIGTISSARGSNVEVRLKLPVCAEIGSRVAVSRRVAGRWRLIGYGVIL
ncbi:MAG: translation initiation factor IF-2 subunit gamma [Hadesarchaea archaeon YNP_N21]|nr:MAG: translation initiation factor IF-2 subunit gamma [Hadesarchaea archaeon YNP_N21]